MYNEEISAKKSDIQISAIMIINQALFLLANNEYKCHISYHIIDNKKKVMVGICNNKNVESPSNYILLRYMDYKTQEENDLFIKTSFVEIIQTLITYGLDNIISKEGNLKK